MPDGRHYIPFHSQDDVVKTTAMLMHRLDFISHLVKTAKPNYALDLVRETEKDMRDLLRRVAKAD